MSRRSSGRCAPQPNERQRFARLDLEDRKVVLGVHGDDRAGSVDLLANTTSSSRRRAVVTMKPLVYHKARADALHPLPHRPAVEIENIVEHRPAHQRADFTHRVVLMFTTASQPSRKLRPPAYAARHGQYRRRVGCSLKIKLPRLLVSELLIASSPRLQNRLYELPGPQRYFLSQSAVYACPAKSHNAAAISSSRMSFLPTPDRRSREGARTSLRRR